MKLDEAMAFIHQTDWKGSHLGLERMRELMRLLGDAQDSLRFVHVAGTNGKGSVCAMLSAVLTAAGYRTGLYTSPHLFRLNERMKVNGEDIPDDALIALAEAVKPAVDRMEDQPTEFEIITAMALLYFERQGCDVVVLEVGLGGRLDATNIISAPEAAVICSIGLEHTEILGDSLEKIAAEKAGIIKLGTSTVLYQQSLEVEDIVRRKCEICGVSLLVTDLTQMQHRSAGLGGQVLNYRGRKNLCLSLLGDYQCQNAAVALDTADVLNSRGFSIPESAVLQGLSQVAWPGRFEVLQKDPLVIVDGAHNPSGVEALAACLLHYVPGRKVTFLMGVMADKDYRNMLETILPFAERFITVTPRNDRALDAEELKTEIETGFGVPALSAKNVQEGVALALRECGSDGMVCALGSLYQAGEVRAYFQK